MSKLKERLRLKSRLENLLNSLDENNSAKFLVEQHYGRLASTETTTVQELNLYEALCRELKVYDWVDEVDSFLKEAKTFYGENETSILVERVLFDLKFNKDKESYVNAISKLEQLSKLEDQNKIKRSIVEGLGNQLWIPNMRALFEYAQNEVGSIDNTNPNYEVSKIYSPIKINENGLSESYSFYVDGKVLKIEEGEIFETDNRELSTDFVNLVNVVNEANIFENTIRFYQRNHVIDVKLNENGNSVTFDDKVIELNNLESVLYSSGTFFVNEREKVSQIQSAAHKGNSIVELDFAYSVKTKTGKSVNIFQIGESVWLQKINIPMIVNEMVGPLTGTEAVEEVKEFINYDISRSVSSLLENDQREKVELLKKKEEVETTISNLLERYDNLMVLSINEGIRDTEEISTAKSLLETAIQNERDNLNQIFKQSQRIATKMEDTFIDAKITKDFGSIKEGFKIKVNASQFSTRNAEDSIDIIFENNTFSVPKSTISVII